MDEEREKIAGYWAYLKGKQRNRDKEKKIYFVKT